MAELAQPLPAERLTRAEILKQIEKLPEHELVYALLHATPARAVVLNAERQILLANEAFGWAARAAGNPHYDGMRVGEALGCEFVPEMAKGGCGTGQHCLDCGLAQAMAAGLGGQVTKKLCLLERGVEGRVESEEAVVSVRPLEESGPARLVCVMADVSDRQRRMVMESQQRQEFQQGVERLKQAAEEALGAQAQDSEAWRKARAVVDAAVQVARQVDGQTALQAAEKGELAVNLREIDAAGLVRAMARRMEAAPAAARRRILVAGEPGMRVSTDPALLQRALEALLTNALEATPDGGSVKVAVAQNRSGVRVEIWNEGVMPANVQRQVFRRSFTTKQNGTGLGAYAAKLYMERYLSGRIGFRSANGEGTTFWLDVVGQ